MTAMTNIQSKDISQQLREHIMQEFAYDRPDLNLTNEFKLMEQGIIDSMGILRLINFIEEQFGIALAPEDLMLENFDTLASMTTLVESKLTPA